MYHGVHRVNIMQSLPDEASIICEFKNDRLAQFMKLNNSYMCIDEKYRVLSRNSCDNTIQHTEG